MNRIYSRRQKLLCSLLEKKGFCAKPSKGTFYLYVKAPCGIKNGVMFRSAQEFSEYMIKEKLISVVPWDDTGRYVRFSLTFCAPTKKEEERILHEVEERLSDCEFIFEE